VLENFTANVIKQDLIAAIESGAQVQPRRSPAINPNAPGAAPPPTTPPPIQFYTEPKALDLSYTPPLKLPLGWTEPALREFVTSIRVEDGPEQELKNYANDDFKRFVYTLALVPDEKGQRILELGANPYFTTTLLKKFRNASLELANFFGDGQAAEGQQKVTINQTGEIVVYNYKHFNIEHEAFPYADASFDVVLFCEILEHLTADPVHALDEIRRILSPGGVLIVTTPNVARLDNVRKMIAGQNIYDPYSGYGPYGRHNREYTQQDVFSLLTANGFRPNSLFTADVTERNAEPSSTAEQIPSLRNRLPELGEYIFCRSTLISGVRETPPVRPNWLYRSMPSHSESA
jgi:SAM-dependent methyltransferase